MAGLVPAIHVLGAARKEDVDARDKPGHDGWQWRAYSVALRGSAPKGAFAPQGDGTRRYSVARLAALANFFSTRSRFSFDR